jgi:hypothetical protein
MIFIPGNVPSSKNSKQIVRSKGRTFLVSSKTTKRYTDNIGIIYKSERRNFLEMIKDKEPPYRVSFKFIRDSRRKFDYINAAQIVQDLMVQYEWIEDDNCEFLIPCFEVYDYDKKNPGVFIQVL